MIRIMSSSSVCHTTISRCCIERPVVKNRSSPTEWSGSATVVANGSQRQSLPLQKTLYGSPNFQRPSVDAATELCGPSWPPRPPEERLLPFEVCSQLVGTVGKVIVGGLDLLGFWWSGLVTSGRGFFPRFGCSPSGSNLLSVMFAQGKIADALHV